MHLEKLLPVHYESAYAYPTVCPSVADQNELYWKRNDSRDIYIFLSLTNMEQKVMTHIKFNFLIMESIQVVNNQNSKIELQPQNIYDDDKFCFKDFCFDKTSAHKVIK